MTKIDIFSGFLGAGKTTLIKKLISEGYKGERLVLIENEFGEIGIDGGFLQDAGIEITEMNSGCICCSLVGDFTKALAKVIDEFHPDRVLIEPSGVGKLSDVIKATMAVEGDAVLNCFTTVADVNKCKMYMKNFGEFYNDQIKHASCIVLSHTDCAKDAKVEEAVALIRQHNPECVIVTTPWDSLSGEDILSAMEHKDTLANAISELEEEHHHHHHHEHGEHCGCGHHHDEHHHEHGEHCGCGHHHDEHHEHGEHCGCGHHHDEHHEHGEHCGCGCHDHDHHHHHADDVFTSFGTETTKKFTMDELNAILDTFTEDSSYGMILRAKGIVASLDGKWLHFDYIPGENNVRYGSAGVIGRLCVIGSDIDNDKIKELFGV